MKKILKYCLIGLAVLITYSVIRFIYEDATALRMVDYRVSPSIVQLKDGRILVTGGYSQLYYDTAEIFDPKTNKFRHTKGKMNIKRAFHKSVLLDDGRVLIVGGSKPGYPSNIPEAELFDPKTEQFTLTGKINFYRSVDFTATTLKDGRVLVACGGGPFEGPRKTNEIYDPKTGKFTKTGDSIYDHINKHTATLLKNGKVLITGGGWEHNTKKYFYEKAEIYDPNTGKFSLTPDMNAKRREHKAILLNDGRVFIVGGYPKEAGPVAEVYDPNTNKFEIVGNTKIQRKGHDLFLLPSGSVLIIGGDFEYDKKSYGGSFQKIRKKGTCELFNPKTQKIKYLGDCLTKDLSGHKTFLIKDKKIIVIGGGNRRMSKTEKRTVKFINLNNIKEN